MSIKHFFQHHVAEPLVRALDPRKVASEKDPDNIALYSGFEYSGALAAIPAIKNLKREMTENNGLAYIEGSIQPKKNNNAELASLSPEELMRFGDRAASLMGKAVRKEVFTLQDKSNKSSVEIRYYPKPNPGRHQSKPRVTLKFTENFNPITRVKIETLIGTEECVKLAADEAHSQHQQSHSPQKQGQQQQMG